MTQLTYFNGELSANRQLSVDVGDVGFEMGVTVSEKLRTFNGRLFHVEEHMKRLDRSLQIVGIEGIDLEILAANAETMATHNHELIQEGDDLNLTVFITPGVHGTGKTASERKPTVGMFTSLLPFQRWSEKYDVGEKLAVSNIRQVPASCWPPELKCRSRMHYYLADREVQRHTPDARALLLDQEGFLSEASTASVLFYRRNEGVIAPPADKVLPSVSVGHLKTFCGNLSIPFVHRDVTVEELSSVDEVWLCSTSPCILPVVCVNDVVFGDGRPGAVFRDVIGCWKDSTGVDIVRQANRFTLR